MKKIATCLWFDDEALEAAKFYVSIFPKSKLGKITRYGEGGPGKKGSVLTVSFTLAGAEFVGLNGGPRFEFSEAISVSVSCKNQKEADTYWRKLTKGGAESKCGWLTDRYGLSWQIVPEELMKLIADKNPGRAKRAMEAMMTMRRIDIAKVRAAANGKD